MASLQERDELIKDEAFTKKMFYYALGKTGDDEVSAMLVVDTKVALFLKSEEQLNEIDNLKGYAFTILKNKIAGYFENKHKNPSFLPLPDLDNVEQVPKPPPVDLKYMLEVIKQERPPLDAKLFELNIIEGYSILETWQMLSLTYPELTYNNLRQKKSLLLVFIKNRFRNDS